MVRRAVMWGSVVVAIAVAGGALVSGQPRTRAATTLDDLLSEVRGLRADVNAAAAANTRIQVLIARGTLLERRLEALSRQYTEAQEELVKARAVRSAEEDRLEQLEEGMQGGRLPPGVPVQEVEALLTALRERELPQLREREASLARRVDELADVLSREETRWVELKTRLDEIESTSTKVPR